MTGAETPRALGSALVCLSSLTSSHQAEMWLPRLLTYSHDDGDRPARGCCGRSHDLHVTKIVPTLSLAPAECQACRVPAGACRA